MAIDGWVFVAGTVGTFEDGTLPGTVGEQTQQTLENIKTHLAAAGLSLADIVSATIYLTDRSQYKDMNEAYLRYFSKPYPARATVVCDLVHEEHLVEITAVARRGAAG
jgi:2-iminobutanoate/2-iminopropanoate deaminase